jgi:hypothetical protein
VQQHIPEMAGLCSELKWDQERWEAWSNLPSPQTASPPGRFSAVSAMQRLLLLKVASPISHK